MGDQWLLMGTKDSHGNFSSGSATCQVSTVMDVLISQLIFKTVTTDVASLGELQFTKTGHRASALGEGGEGMGRARSSEHREGVQDCSHSVDIVYVVLILKVDPQNPCSGQPRVWWSCILSFLSHAWGK